MKGSVLELGGKDAMLVLSDANLPNAVSGALWCGFANAGQACSGIERVCVMRDVADRFTEELVRGASELRVGNPLERSTEIGQMVSREQFELVCELVDDAVAAGAELRCGGPVIFCFLMIRRPPRFLLCPTKAIFRSPLGGWPPR